MTRLKQCTTPRPNRVTGTLRADFRTLFTFQEKFVVVLRFARSCYYFKVVVSKHFYKPPIQSSNPNMACFKEINDDLLKLGVKFICYFVVQKVSWIVYCGQTSWKAKHVGYLVIPLFGMFGMSLKLEENILKTQCDNNEMLRHSLRGGCNFSLLAAFYFTGLILLPG